MLAERQKIGCIAPGEAAVTAAFQLPAKYIIHTVGPAWVDGNHGEFDILRSCYRKSLLLAEQLGCQSIAFPLIATGVYGFPKDEALATALAVIGKHLESSELNVILVVFCRDSYQIAADLNAQIEAYIDENYVAAQTAREYGDLPISRAEDARRRRLWESERYLGSAPAADRAARALPDLPAVMDMETPPESAAPPVCGRSPRPAKAALADVVNNLGESFQQRLLRMIDERGMTDPEVYKRANVDRKLFSKIRCREDYIPKKKTIVALAIALRLSLDDAKDLLASAGFTLTNNSKADLIVSFCIENGIYDILEVNALLFQFDQPTLD